MATLWNSASTSNGAAHVVRAICPGAFRVSVALHAAESAHEWDDYFVKYLAHLSGMHRTYVGGIERGERNVSYANMLRLAGALGVPASQLLSRAEDQE